MKNVIFVCGTDTGAGKTVLTGMLTAYARMNGIDAVAIKPFCSGDLSDVEFLRECQDFRLETEQINPWFFEKPLSPYAAIYKEKSKNRFVKPLSIKNVVGHIAELSKKYELVFVEGIGGAMVPVEKKFLFIDLILKCNAPAILVAKNKLGTINHTILNLKYFKKCDVKCRCVVLMNEAKPDLSSNSNREIIADFSGKIEVFEIPFLRDITSEICQEKKVAKKLKKILALF